MACVRRKFGGFWSQEQYLYCPLAHWFLDNISLLYFPQWHLCFLAGGNMISVLQDQSWVALSCLPHCHQKTPPDVCLWFFHCPWLLWSWLQGYFVFDRYHLWDHPPLSYPGEAWEVSWELKGASHDCLKRKWTKTSLLLPLTHKLATVPPGFQMCNLKAVERTSDTHRTLFLCLIARTVKSLPWF